MNMITGFLKRVALLAAEPLRHSPLLAIQLHAQSQSERHFIIEVHTFFLDIADQLYFTGVINKKEKRNKCVSSRVRGCFPHLLNVHRRWRLGQRTATTLSRWHRRW
jgi:hypothetical protein